MRHKRPPQHCDPPQQQISVTVQGTIVVEHRHQQQLPSNLKLRFVGREVGKQTDLPPEIKQILKDDEPMQITIKADEFAKFGIVSTDESNEPTPVDEDEPIRNLVEEGSVRVVVGPTRGPNNERWIYFVPSSPGTSTGRTIVDGEPGSGQTFLEHAWTVTATPASKPATKIDLVNVETGKQTALPQEIKDLLEPVPPVEPTPP